MAIRSLHNARSTRRSTRSRQGFSLVELLVVILIIAIIVAIVLPALSGVRGTARDTESRSLATNIANAASTFYNDKRKSPGYFSPQEMGAASNQDRGFTAMQNAMLDLAGGVVKPGTPGAFLIGPSNIAARQVLFVPDAVGAASNGNYFTPPAKYMKLQNGLEGGVREGNTDHARVPELVDAEGQPILAWVEDPTAKQTVESVADFAKPNSPGNNANDVAARFYLVSNRALLASTSFGKQRKDQSSLSLVSPGAANPETSLTGILGNPGAPNDTSANLVSILPTRSRGNFIVHAAGRDGVILNRQGSKTGRVVDNSGILYYGSNFKSLPGPAGTVIRDSTGKAISEDVATAFDDIIASSN